MDLKSQLEAEEISQQMIQTLSARFKEIIKNLEIEMESKKQNLPSTRLVNRAELLDH